MRLLAVFLFVILFCSCQATGTNHGANVTADILSVNF